MKFFPYLLTIIAILFIYFVISFIVKDKKGNFEPNSKEEENMYNNHYDNKHLK